MESKTEGNESSGLKLFAKDDLSAFWALFADNLANLLVVVGVCSFLFKMPGEVVFGHILPGLGLALLFGLGSYAYLAQRLARREGRGDVTALPYGISTPILFIYLFGIIGPVYWASNDALLAWRVGLAAAFIGGVIEMAGSVAGPWLKKHLPRAGMLGTLAGIALTFIAAVHLAEIFEHPLIGLPSLAIVLIGLVAMVRLPLGLPAGLAAIVVGVVIGLFTGDAQLNLEGLGFYPPLPVFSDLWAGLEALWRQPWILAVVVPAEIYNFIETMNNVESAEVAGDAYPVRTCQIIDGAGTMLGALFGSAFPTTVYIGHPGYKRMGGRAGYALGVGVTLFFAACFGLLSVLQGLVPMAAVAPILVFIGLVITAQAFRASPAAHGMAVAFAMLPHLSNLLVTKWNSLHQALGQAAADKLSGELPGLDSPVLLNAMLQKGAHLEGHSLLAGGAILVGMLWGSAAAFIIDKNWTKAAIILGAGGLLSLFGVIHAPKLGLFTASLTWSYFGLGLAFVGVGLARKFFPPMEGEDHAN